MTTSDNVDYYDDDDNNDEDDDDDGGETQANKTVRRTTQKNCTMESVTEKWKVERK